MFSTETNGYKKDEVDKKLNSILVELTNLKRANLEKDKLNFGLINALEKSKQIEASSKNLYDLRIQKILILYKSLEKSFKNLFRLYPQISEFEDINKAFNDFSKSVETSLIKQEQKRVITSTVNTDNDTIRLLLNKMSSYSANNSSQNFVKPIVREKKSSYETKQTSIFNDTKTSSNTDNISITEKQTTIKRKDNYDLLNPESHPSIIKPIANISLENNENYESLADKFLASKTTESNAYTKIINNKRPNDLYPEPNESGFDLKEAVNPKDNLSEIMKSFNLDD